MANETARSRRFAEQAATYDALNRLDLVERTAGGSTATTMDPSYHKDGNIAAKAYDGGNGVGTYNYATSGTNAGPHAVGNIVGSRGGTFHYDGAGNLDCRAWNTGSQSCATNSGITWWSFNLPQRIYLPGTAGNYADFSYGPNRERVRTTEVNNTATPSALTSTFWQVGGHFEVESRSDGWWRYRSRVYFGERPVFDHVVKLYGSYAPDLEEAYLHVDHQGSLDRVTPATYAVTGQTSTSFDAFGKRRATNWSNNNTDTLFNQLQFAETGYTGHQHLDSVKLIHMNGRVQDPIWGRMLSPDPMVGDLTSPQSLNPYSYVGNNPLTLIDPTGFAADLSKVWQQCLNSDNCIPVSTSPFNRSGDIDPITGHSTGFGAAGATARLDSALEYVRNSVSLSRLQARVGRLIQGSLSYVDSVERTGVSGEGMSQGTQEFGSGASFSWTVGQIEVGWPLESLSGESGFLGGGLTFGTNTYGQLYLSGFYTTTVGRGAVAAVTGGPGGGLLSKPLPPGPSSETQWYRSANAGIGEIGGSISASGANNPFEISVSGGAVRGGFVIGANDATGTITSGTLATPPFLDLAGTLGR